MSRTQFVQKITGNPPATSGDSTYEIGWGYDSNGKCLRVDGHIVGGRTPFETLAAAKTLTFADTGKTFKLNLATGFAVTLPAVSAGLFFRFIVSTAPSGGAYTIITPGSANLAYGLVLNSTGASSAAGCLSDGLGDTVTLVDGQAVIGDMVEVFCDGTNWFVYCFVNAAAGATVTTAS